MQVQTISEERRTVEERSPQDDMQLPADASVLTRIRGALKAFRALQKSPDDPVAAALLNACLDADVFHRHAATLAKTEEGRTLFADRPEINTRSVDFDALCHYPEGTVGRAFGRYFAENGIKPFHTDWDVSKDGDYLMQWYRETHDLQHIVTGYGTDGIGEMEVQAFVMGNVGFRHNWFILLVSAIVRPADLPPVWKYWDRLHAAYQRGKRSRNLLSTRFDRYFAEKIETLRAEMAIPSS